MNARSKPKISVTVQKDFFLCHFSHKLPLQTHSIQQGHLSDLPDKSAGPEDMALSQELDSEMQAALGTLPRDFRMAVILSDIEGLSYEEISEAMGCSIGTVRSRLHRGRRLLREKLRPYLE